MIRLLSAVAAIGLATLAAQPVQATGKMTCNVPAKNMKSIASLQTKLVKDGWQVRKAKVDGGCYEVYGTDPQGRRVEAYFNPATFKLLLSSRRGEVLYKAR